MYSHWTVPNDAPERRRPARSNARRTACPRLSTLAGPYRAPPAGGGRGTVAMCQRACPLRAYTLTQTPRLWCRFCGRCSLGRVAPDAVNRSSRRYGEPTGHRRAAFDSGPRVRPQPRRTRRPSRASRPADDEPSIRTDPVALPTHSTWPFQSGHSCGGGTIGGARAIRRGRWRLGDALGAPAARTPERH